MELERLEGGGAEALFLCNTYMQLITAAQIQLRLLRSANADLLLTDHCVGAEGVARALGECGLFRRVRLAATKRLVYGGSRWRSLAGALRLAAGGGGACAEQLWPGAAYDRIFYFNLDPLAEGAFERSLALGRMPRCVRFEEGVLSYGELSVLRGGGGRMRLALALRDALGRQSVASRTGDFLCYYPELFPGERCRAIPRLSRGQRPLVEALNHAFGYEPARDAYPQKYIFFGSAGDVDGRSVGETELVLELAERVGRGNLLVKMHPRDGRRVYEERGIAVSRSSAAPWELIQLNREFRGHVFLTLASGSVLNASAMLGDRVPTCFLYPLVRGRDASFDRFCEGSVAPTLRALRRLGAMEAARVIHNLREICG